MFTPKWKKHAIQLVKGSKKFVHYKRDLLEEDRIKEIASRQADLKAAIKEKDKEKVKEAGKMLEKTCQNALPTYRSPSALAENVEVFFVAIVIALGIRAYFLQPFRIPTGSMQPTLNGLIGKEVPKDEWPSLPMRAVEWAAKGRSYITLKSGNKPMQYRGMSDGTSFHFFSRCKVQFSGGYTDSVSGSASAVWTAGFERKMIELAYEQFGKHKTIQLPDGTYKTLSKILSYDGKMTAEENYAFTLVTIPANTTLASGYVASGDLILVDKMSYHFRKPRNGEVMVFDTRDIKGIQEMEQPGSHYIKRLIGSPGDTISLRNASFQTNGKLGGALIYRNGEKAKEDGILKVESAKNGYEGYYVTGRIIDENKAVKLKYDPSTGLSEYWLMGDNSGNSFDSRGWGTVKEYNVVGPAFFSLWPFGSGHWGTIK